MLDLWSSLSLKIFCVFPFYLSFNIFTLVGMCFWIVILEKTLESPLDCKEIKSVNLKGNQPWIFIWRTDAEAETTILWPPDAKKQLIGKDPDDGRLSSGEQGDKGWDGWMASLTQWTWVWANSGSWTGRPAVLQSMWFTSRTQISDWTWY